MTDSKNGDVPKTTTPRTWADVAYLAVCLFGGAAILFSLGQCNFEVKFRDPDTKCPAGSLLPDCMPGMSK